MNAGTIVKKFFSIPQAIENVRQYLLLRTNIYRKQSLGAPVLSLLLYGYSNKNRSNQTE